MPPIEILEHSVPEFVFALHPRHPYLRREFNRMPMMELGLYTFADVNPNPFRALAAGGVGI
ncbi:hypothetical protein, partial [Rhizobium leguminosarum]|uniref:hypothetical protein n=1 Tax=Rhizobium leguminosarum TaxID=384 RepID=UPI003F948718